MKGKKYVLIITTILMGVSMISCNSKKEEKVSAVGYNHIREMETTTATATETATPDTATATVTPVQEEKKAEQEDEIVYTTDIVNMREDASLDSPVIEVLQTGTEVKKISEKDGWTKVKRGETEGYIVSQYLTVTKPEINEVVEENNNAVGDTNNSAEENNYVAENNNPGVVNSTPQSKPSNNTNNTQSKPSNNNTQSKPENNQSSGESNQDSNTQPTAPSQPEESNPPKQEVIIRHNHWGEFPSTDTYYGTIFTDKDCSEGYSMTVSQYNKFKSEGRIGITTYYESINGGEVHSEQVEYLMW